MPRDLRAELAGGSSDGPTSWAPEPGDVLVCRMAKYVSRKTKYGDQSGAIVTDEEGQELCLWFGAVLRSAFEKERPQRGERMGIAYDGRHPEKGYHRYRLVVDREEVPPPAPRSTDRGQPYAAATLRQPARVAAPAAVSSGPDDDGFDPFNHQ